MNEAIFVVVELLNSYVKTLTCIYYRPKANPTIKQILPLDDVNLTTHLLHMCPSKWITQYNLTQNTTPMSTRSLVLVLEDIKNNTEADAKPLGNNNPKMIHGKREIESIDSQNPKRQKWDGLKNIVPYAKSIRVQKQCMLCMIAAGTIEMSLLLRGA